VEWIARIQSNISGIVVNYFFNFYDTDGEQNVIHSTQKPFTALYCEAKRHKSFFFDEMKSFKMEKKKKKTEMKKILQSFRTDE
jgi:hypothetical protein